MTDTPERRGGKERRETPIRQGERRTSTDDVSVDRRSGTERRDEERRDEEDRRRT